MVFRETDRGRTYQIVPTVKGPTVMQPAEPVPTTGKPVSPDFLIKEKERYDRGISSLVKKPEPVPPPYYYTAEYPRKQIVSNTAHEFAAGLQSFIKERQRYVGQISRLEHGGLEAQYVMQESGTTGRGRIRGWSKGQILTGGQLIDIIKGEQKAFTSSYAEYARSQKKLITMAKESPEGTTFTKTVGETGVSYQMNIQKPSDVLLRTYGGERLDLYIAKGAQDWGVPAGIAGFQTITGIDKNAWENLRQQYAAEIVGFTRKKGESIESYTGRFWTSEQAITNVYLPVATMGLGYGVKPYLIGTRVINPTGKFATKVLPKLTTVYSFGSKYSRPLKMGLGVAVGAPVAYSIISSPEQIPLTIGRTTAGLGKMAGGFVAGEKIYVSTHASLIRKTYWTGTQYESYITEMSRRGAILESQHKPFEWGTPGTHYSVVIAPSYAKMPYVPKTPQQLHTTTRVFSEPLGDISQDFILKRPTVSKRAWSYEITTPSSEKGVSITTGKMVTKERFVRDISGYGYSQEWKEFGDISIHGTSGKGVGREFFKGTVIKKTIPAETNVPTKTGFTSVENPVEVTYTISRAKTPYYEFIDLGKQYRGVVKVKEHFGGGSMGLDTTGVVLAPSKTEMILPGGVSEFQGKQTFGSLTKLGGFSKMGKRATLFVETETREVSSYWTGVKPRLQMSRLGLKTGIVQFSLEGKTLSSNKMMSQISVSSYQIRNITKTREISFEEAKEMTTQETGMLTKQRNVSLSLVKNVSLTKTTRKTIQVQTHRFGFFSGFKPMGISTRPYVGFKWKGKTGVVPPVYPIIPLDMGGGGSSGGPGFSWRARPFGGKRKVSLKMVLADPFSVMESQQKYGKATHQLPTRKVWREAERAGWKLGTVEMRGNKIKRLSLKHGKKKKRKKR